MQCQSDILNMVVREGLTQKKSFEQDVVKAIHKDIWRRNVPSRDSKEGASPNKFKEQQEVQSRVNKGQKWEGKQEERRWGQQIARVLDAVRRPLLFLSEVENHWSFCTDAKDWYYQICLLAGPPYREQTARKYKQKRETSQKTSGIIQAQDYGVLVYSIAGQVMRSGQNMGHFGRWRHTEVADRLRKKGQGWSLSSVQFSRSVMSYSLRPHELQHARPPCPSPTPGVYPNPCLSSR